MVTLMVSSLRRCPVVLYSNVRMLDGGGMGWDELGKTGVHQWFSWCPTKMQVPRVCPPGELQRTRGRAAQVNRQLGRGRQVEHHSSQLCIFWHGQDMRTKGGNRKKTHTQHLKQSSKHRPRHSLQILLKHKTVKVLKHRHTHKQTHLSTKYRRPRVKPVWFGRR